jgi:hypothetical protein
MKTTQLQRSLRTISPHIVVQTIWQHDTELVDIRTDVDGMDKNPATISKAEYEMIVGKWFAIVKGRSGYAKPGHESHKIYMGNGWNSVDADELQDALGKNWWVENVNGYVSVIRYADDWQAWTAEVRASATSDDRDVSVSAFLCGVWAGADELPEESNPTVSGYEIDLTIQALGDLATRIDDYSLLQNDIEDLVKHLKALPQ